MKGSKCIWRREQRQLWGLRIRSTSDDSTLGVLCSASNTSPTHLAPIASVLLINSPRMTHVRSYAIVDPAVADEAWRDFVARSVVSNPKIVFGSTGLENK